MKPTRPINCTNRPDWRYTSAAKTDVAATMRAAVRRQEAAAEALKAHTPATQKRLAVAK